MSMTRNIEWQRNLIFFERIFVMATVFIYNNSTNRVEKYTLSETSPMPYVYGNTMSVREFRGNSCSSVLWSDKYTLEAWNNLRGTFGRPIPIGAAFKRIWEGGHGSQSQHYAGTAFDMGQRLTQAQRVELYSIALRSGVWSFVEPMSMTPTWVHVDRRWNPPACPAGGYPLQREGAKGNYVFVLQDALAALGYPWGGLDGVFGPGVRSSVMTFQRDHGLVADGVVGCLTWSVLAGAAVGVGQTSSVIGKCGVNYAGE